MHQLTSCVQCEPGDDKSGNAIVKNMKLELNTQPSGHVQSASVSLPVVDPLSSTSETPIVNGTSSSAPQTPQLSPSPTDSDCIIGVLPNGVHVSHLAYSSAVKSAIMRALPTQGDVIKAANLTAQLTLQYMVQLNAAAQSKAVVLNGSADAAASLLQSQLGQATPQQPGSPVAVPEAPKLPVVIVDPPLQRAEKKSVVTRKVVEGKAFAGKRRRYFFVEADSQNEGREDIPEFNYTRKHFKLDENPTRRKYKTKGGSAAVTKMQPSQKDNAHDHRTYHKSYKSRKGKSVKGKKLKEKGKLESDPIRSKGRDSLKIISDGPVGESSAMGVAGSPHQDLDEKEEESVSNSSSASAEAARFSRSMEEPRHDLLKVPKGAKTKQSPNTFRKKAKSLSPVINIKRLSAIKPNSGVTDLDNLEDVKSILKPPPTISNPGYVRRMASLNARACVSAILESNRSNPKSQKRDLAVVSKKPSTSLKPSRASLEEKSEKASSSVETWTALQYVCLNLDPGNSRDITEEPANYNTLGLLHNGSSVHPLKCRVFYSNNRTLSLPRFIVPTLVPSRVHNIADRIEKESGNRVLRRKLNKGTKVRVALWGLGCQ